MADAKVFSDEELLRAAAQPKPQPAEGVDDETLLQAVRFNKPNVKTPEPSLLDKGLTYISDAGTAIKRAATGEGRTQYEDMPELTEANVGFVESFVPTMKMGLTVDPGEKAGILAEHFKDDKRFGGVFQDDKGNPIVVWEDKPYYVNKPGFSEQDLNDVIAQGIQLLPAAKVAGSAKTVLGRFAAGVPTYAGTNIAQQYGTRLLGGKDAVDLDEAGKVGVVGGAVEAVLPPVLNAGTKLGKRLIEGAKRTSVPAYTAANIGSNAQALGQRLAGTTDDNAIPLTQGQRTGDVNVIRREEAMRQGAHGDAASGIMRNFDDLQNTTIQNEAGKLQSQVGAGTGFVSQNVAVLGEKLQGGLVQAKDAARSGVRAAYDKAATLDARLSTDGLRSLSESVRDGLKGMPLDNELTPAGIRAVKEIGKLAQLQGGNVKALTLKRLETTRRKLGAYIGAAKNLTDKQAATIVKRKLDDWVDKAIDDALFSGDPEALTALKNARELRREYALKFEAGKTASGAKDPAGAVMVKILDEAQATPEQVINFITGYGRITSDAKAVGLVKRIKSVFGDNSEEVRLLKDAFLLKAFTQEIRGQREITPHAIAKGAAEFLYGSGLTLGKELFTAAERRDIGNFGMQVSKTLTPADARNPSRSAWAIFQLLRDNNLLTVAGKALKPIPLAGELGGTVESVGGAISAKNATSQLERLRSLPLVEAGAAAGADKTRRAAVPQMAKPKPQPTNVVPIKTNAQMIGDRLMPK